MLQKLVEALGISKAWARTVVLLSIIWISIIVLSGAGWNPFGVAWSFANPGAFGDSFGPLSTIMAAIAAIGAIAAYRAQAREAARTKAREDEQDLISMSDRERFLRREIEADKRLEKTAFETTFFKLLEALRSIVSSIDIRTSKGPVVSAHDAFRAILNRMDDLSRSHDTVKDAWSELSEQYVNDLNHYFRFLYHVVRYVDSSAIDNKYFYVRFLRAMLSEAELVLLALNCQYGEGREKFKRLVEKYSLLHNISDEARHEWLLDDAYAESAFGQPEIDPSNSEDNV